MSYVYEVESGLFSDYCGALNSDVFRPTINDPVVK